MFIMTNGGDSQSAYDAGYFVRPSRTHVPVTARLLGPLWLGRAFGTPGDRSDQLLARLDVMTMYDVPDIANLAIGVNDPGTLTQAQTQANIQASIMALKHHAVGLSAPAGQLNSGLGGGCTVATVADLPVSAPDGTRFVVLNDTDTTGGVAAISTSQAATIAGSVAADGNGQRQAVWERRLPQAGARGWGRVAKTGQRPSAGGVQRIFVTTPPYRNFTTNGDTPTGGAAGGPNATVRAAQQAAVAAEAVNLTNGEPSVIWVNLYAWMAARITAGTDPDFTTVAYDQTRSWHWQQNNQHYNDYGHYLQAIKQAADIRAAWPSLFAA